MFLRITRRLLSSPPLPSLVSFRHAPAFRPAPPGTNFKHDPAEVPCFVLPDVVSEAQEAALLHASGTWFDRVDSITNHVDQLIHHYKEFYRPLQELLVAQSPLLADALQHAKRVQEETTTEPTGTQKPSCSGSQQGEPRSPAVIGQDVALCQSAIRRCHTLAQQALATVPLSHRVHFLQLTGSGFIRAHVDEARNSCGIVAGLTLGSARVMSLTHPKHPSQRIDLFLKPRSFYMLLGTARTEWEHSVDWLRDDEEHQQRERQSLVVDGSEVLFDGQPTGLHRHTRTAVIFRGVSPMDLLMHRMRQEEQQE